MTNDGRYDFFIAYASPDSEAAEALYELLSPPFNVFLDRRSLVPGEDWSSSLSAAQRRTSVTLILISSYTEAAHYQREEIAAAVELSRKADDQHRVVPIFLNDVGADAQLPYGLRIRQGISAPQVGGLTGVAVHLKATLQQSMAMQAAEIRRRYDDRVLVDRAIRLIPRRDFHRDGLLGLIEREYVFIGDYDEQRHRTLRQILSNLLIGDAFERVDNSNIAWIAISFELGELNRRKMDLMPATWKAVFRILSDPKRAACFSASDEERTRLGDTPRDYYSDDQRYWYSRCTTGERRYTTRGADYYLRGTLGISWLCFTGKGITERRAGVPSRVFLVKNMPLASVRYRVQELGVPDDGISLD